MTPDESPDTSFPIDQAEMDDSNPVERDESASTEDSAEIQAARQAWDNDDPDSEDPDSGGDQDSPEMLELARPFVGRWNDLISTTNWEKGRIISQWREALIESGAEAQHYSDEAWSRRVGGVTAPHVGRLRRVHDRFVTTYETYQGLYWSHFLAALDWDDAPLWLEGASQEKWSVSRMRQQRWEANGAIESGRPQAGEIVVVDTDEDVVLPAQGGGRTKEYGDEPGVSSGPVHEEPDFGEEEELMSLAGPTSANPTESEEKPPSAVQPFAGLPELPEELSEAIESLKLAILRHKSAGWKEIDAETVRKYLDAIAIMMLDN